jgi:hypothetical protein
VSTLVAESESNVILDTVIANVRVKQTQVWFVTNKYGLHYKMIFKNVIFFQALVANIDIMEMPTIGSHIKVNWLLRSELVLIVFFTDKGSSSLCDWD